jgi:hypothetical protein
LVFVRGAWVLWVSDFKGRNKHQRLQVRRRS